MRAIIQKVTNASVVTMDDMIISAIGAGLVVWVGMCRTDKQADINFIVKHILNLQIYDKDEQTNWAKTVVDKDYEILCLSEMTLYAATRGHYKPNFQNCMDSDTARIFFSNFVNQLKQSYKPDKVRRGRYGGGSLVNAQFVGSIFSIQSPRKKGIIIDQSFPYPTKKARNPTRRRAMYSQYWSPTRTIPQGVGKFYGQQQYYRQPSYGHIEEGYGQIYNHYNYAPQTHSQYEYQAAYNPYDIPYAEQAYNREPYVHPSHYQHNPNHYHHNQNHYQDIENVNSSNIQTTQK